MPKRGSGTFPYPGGKTTLAPWIVDHIPEHDCYVEPFGGSAAVLMAKDRSRIEIYNDLDSEIVELFETICKHGDDLEHRLINTPHSFELFEEWAGNRAAGDTADCPVERSRRQFALRCMSYGGKINPPTFGRGKSAVRETDSRADKLKKAVDRLTTVRDRFRAVTLENLPYDEVIDRYDSEDTFFYVDPPYVDKDYYAEGAEFDHSDLRSVLLETDGKWAVSYDELPVCWSIDDWHVSSRNRTWKLDIDSQSEGAEKLLMNYDPAKTAMFSASNGSLAAFADGGSE